jgi:GntR family transcriptional repressor for pyruvate dehydrogenase complex
MSILIPWGECVTAVQPMRVVKSQKVSAQVYEQLLAQIRNNTWPAGAKLPSENELRLQMGVSRISIREAMQKLTALGIVETRQGEGSFVKKVTSDSYKDMLFPMFMINKNTLQEILEYRLVMEVGIARIAAMKVTPAELIEMEAIVQRMENTDADVHSFAADDTLFHMAVAKATKNTMLINVCLFVQDLLSQSMESIVEHLGMRDGRYYHRLILEEMKKGNGEGAARAMHEHVAVTVDRVAELSEL